MMWGGGGAINSCVFAIDGWKNMSVEFIEPQRGRTESKVYIYVWITFIRDNNLFNHLLLQITKSVGSS